MILTTLLTIYRDLVRPDVMDGSVSYVTLNSCGITLPCVHANYSSCLGLPCVGIDLLQLFSEEFVWVIDVEVKIGEEVRSFSGVLDICHHETAGEITV
jgi:hypothetical protein